MQRGRWSFRISKNDDGKYCLELWGRFYPTAKHIVYVTALLTVISSSASFVMQYFL